MELRVPRSTVFGWPCFLSGHKRKRCNVVQARGRPFARPSMCWRPVLHLISPQGLSWMSLLTSIVAQGGYFSQKNSIFFSNSVSAWNFPSWPQQFRIHIFDVYVSLIGSCSFAVMWQAEQIRIRKTLLPRQAGACPPMAGSSVVPLPLQARHLGTRRNTKPCHAEL